MGWNGMEWNGMGCDGMEWNGMEFKVQGAGAGAGSQSPEEWYLQAEHTDIIIIQMC